MITQKIIARTDSLKLDKIISRYGEDSMRQVVFLIVRPDPDSEELIPITIPEDAVGSFRILKPSGNFVIVPMSKSVLSTGETAFDVVLPASANTAKGSGYYDIRITSDTDKYYFTAQGDFIIDDNIISDEVLEDVSEVNQVVFPDDFYTKNDHVAIINDDTVSANTTWSSEKISNQIDIIDDDSVSTDTTWSSDKISNQIDIIDDDSVSTDTTWSSDKIQDEIENNSGKHDYSTTEQVVGKWIDGNPLYERTFDRHLTPLVMSAYRWYAFDNITDSIHIIDAYGITVDNSVIDSYYPIVSSHDNNGDISIMHLRSGVQISMGYVTIRYTKEV